MLVGRDDKQKGLEMCSRAISRLWHVEMKNKRVLKIDLGSSRGCVGMRLKGEKKIIRILRHDFKHVQPRRVMISGRS